MLGATNFAQWCYNRHAFKDGVVLERHTLSDAHAWVAVLTSLVVSLLVFFLFYWLMITVLPKGPRLCMACTAVTRRFSQL